MAAMNIGRRDFISSDQVNHFEENNLQVNFLNLPCEAQLHIFSFLTHEELCKSVAPVCHKWWRLSEDPSLWKSVTILVHRLEQKPKFVRLLKRCSTMLRRLRIKTSFSLKEFAVATSACPNLKYLDLSGTSLDKRVLSLFIRNCPLIEELNMESCGPYEKPNDALAIAFLKHLRVLNLAEGNSEYSLLDDTSIQLISENCTRLEDLNIFEAGFEITDNAICKLTENLQTTLRRLVLGGVCLNWSDLAFSKIVLCTKLQDLSIDLGDDVLLTDEILVYLQMLTGLKSLMLNLPYRSLTTDAVNNFFAGPHVHTLVNLELMHISIDDDGVYNVTQNCKFLKTLSLPACYAVTEVGFEHIVKHCSNLTYLNLSYLNRLKGFCLQLIPEKLSFLEFLHLYAVKDIAASILSDLGIRMPKLKISLEWNFGFSKHLPGRRSELDQEFFLYGRLP